jgi:hypothetical protein
MHPLCSRLRPALHISRCLSQGIHGRQARYLFQQHVCRTFWDLALFCSEFIAPHPPHPCSRPHDLGHMSSRAPLQLYGESFYSLCLAPGKQDSTSTAQNEDYVWPLGKVFSRWGCHLDICCWCTSHAERDRVLLCGTRCQGR